MAFLIFINLFNNLCKKVLLSKNCCCGFEFGTSFELHGDTMQIINNFKFYCDWIILLCTCYCCALQWTPANFYREDKTYLFPFTKNTFISWLCDQLFSSIRAMSAASAKSLFLKKVTIFCYWILLYTLLWSSANFVPPSLFICSIPQLHSHLLFQFSYLWQFYHLSFLAQ